MVLRVYCDKATSIDWVRQVPSILTERSLTQDCRGTTVNSNTSQVALVTAIYVLTTAALGEYLTVILSDPQLQIGLYASATILAVGILIHHHFVS